jgi:hypothetical protein
VAVVECNPDIFFRAQATFVQDGMALVAITNDDMRAIPVT